LPLGGMAIQTKIFFFYFVLSIILFKNYEFNIYFETLSTLPINKIPFNSFFRKIIGFLKAIEQKAKYIYETNDFNSAENGLL
jgi:hypothetical protein